MTRIILGGHERSVLRRLRVLRPGRLLLPLFPLALPTTGYAQQQTATPAVVAVSDTVRVVAGARYAGGALQRFLFGAGWRDLWTTPILVPILDLARTAGGLRPVVRGGGSQTRSLELVGADGREFRFRSVDKDPSHSLPGALRLPGIVSMVRDQTSALHPAGALVAASLAEAADIPHVVPTLVVMPDDPELGQFRQEFAGMLGMLEERPTPRPGGQPSLFGFRRVTETDSLIPRAGAMPPPAVDARRYVAARLLDLLMNDWDRHGGNWLWGTRDATPPYRWVAIPKDRDHVFASYEGVVPAIVRVFVPKLLPFTSEYRLDGLIANAAALDRRILTGLPDSVWDSVSAAMAAKLTDADLEAAVRSMPGPYYRLSGEEIVRRLRDRRSRLPTVAREWAARLKSGTGRLAGHPQLP